MSSYQFIINNQQLADYCLQLSSAKHIALDSEFIRTRTFYPQLGLLQIFDGNDVALIDPITINNWQPFIDILNDHNIEKYFHSCSEDIDVFLHYFKVIPTPLIDSQILAAFLGNNSLSMGYATLVKQFLDVELDKSETRTDWLHRPLTEKQCQYAANDVFYLIPLMNKLKAQLLEHNWLTSAYQECETMLKRKQRQLALLPELAYLQIKNAWQLKPAQLAILQPLAQWRLNYAKQHDIALNFVVHEDVLWKIARYQPTTLAELSQLGMRNKEVRLYGDSILSLSKRANYEVPEIRKIANYPDYKNIMQQIKAASAEITEKTGLSSELLASKRQSEQFIKWHKNNTESAELPELLNGWRKELFQLYLDKGSFEL